MPTLAGLVERRLSNALIFVMLFAPGALLATHASREFPTIPAGSSRPPPLRGNPLTARTLDDAANSPNRETLLLPGLVTNPSTKNRGSLKPPPIIFPTNAAPLHPASGVLISNRVFEAASATHISESLGPIASARFSPS